jgi:hypothetical protein
MEYTRNCPVCDQVIFYKSYNGFYNAKRKNSKCRLCVSKSNGFYEKYIVNAKTNNAFKGKKHTEEYKRRSSESRKGRKDSLETIEKKRNASLGSKNPMFGQSVYELWFKKYGKEEADRLNLIRREKNKIASSGSNNPMYGKPAPKGSGNGWKGYYKNIFFRSLRELTYLVYLHENNIRWESAETKKFQIKFSFLGVERTYRPDFIINDKILVELKPERLINTPSISAKTKAAKEFCLINNMEYQIFDPGILSPIKIQQLMENQEIKFEPKYLIKIQEYFKDYNDKVNKGKIGAG